MVSFLDYSCKNADQNTCPLLFANDTIFGGMGLGIEPKDILPLSYTPSPVLFFILKLGLTKSLRISLNC